MSLNIDLSNVSLVVVGEPPASSSTPDGSLATCFYLGRLADRCDGLSVFQVVFPSRVELPGDVIEAPAFELGSYVRSKH